MSNLTPTAQDDLGKSLAAMIEKGKSIQDAMMISSEESSQRGGLQDAMVSTGEGSQRVGREDFVELGMYVMNHKYLPGDAPFSIFGLRIGCIRRITDTNEIVLAIPTSDAFGRFTYQLQMAEGKEHMEEFDSLTAELNDDYTLTAELSIQVLGNKISKKEYMQNKNSINFWLTEDFYHFLRGMEKGRRGKLTVPKILRSKRCHEEVLPKHTNQDIFRYLLQRLEGVDITPNFITLDAYSCSPSELDLTGEAFYLVSLKRKHSHKPINLDKKQVVDRLVGDPNFRVGFWKALPGKDITSDIGNPRYKGVTKEYVFHLYGSTRTKADSSRTTWSMREYTLSSTEENRLGEDLAVCSFFNKAWPSAKK